MVNSLNSCKHDGILFGPARGEGFQSPHLYHCQIRSLQPELGHGNSTGAQQRIWNLGADSPWLKWSHSSPFWELKCHPASQKACVEKGSTADGPETPMFFPSARRHPETSIEESGSTSVWTWSEPVPPGDVYPPFPGVMSPSLRVGDAFI